MAKKEEKIEVEGTVMEALPNTQFTVELDNGHRVLSYLSGQDAQILYSHLVGRSRKNRNEPLRYESWAHHLSP